LIGIIGPNGAGKTTLLEAIAYALYGVTATRGAKESLRRRGAPPRSRFEVTLDFSLGAHRYSITRTLTAAELSQDGHPIANSTGAVTERVTSLLGMSRDEFFNTYFTGQKELAVMAAMGATERAQFLSRVLGYEKLREAQDRLRERRTSLKAELTGIEQGLADPAALEAELRAAAEALERSRAERDAALAAEQAASGRLAGVDGGGGEAVVLAGARWRTTSRRGTTRGHSCVLPGARSGTGERPARSRPIDRDGSGNGRVGQPHGGTRTARSSIRRVGCTIEERRPA